MNSQFKANLLKVLANKKSNKGFTLIELLVVVIIIGVLAAVALPNLLGQVGKARETEGKTAMGAINRAQQGVYLEQKKFYADTATDPDTQQWKAALGVNPGEEFYEYTNTTDAGDAKVATSSITNVAVAKFVADAKAPGDNGTRDFAASMAYNSEVGIFKSATCVAITKEDDEGTQTALADASILLNDATKENPKADQEDPVNNPDADADAPCQVDGATGSLIK